MKKIGVKIKDRKDLIQSYLDITKPIHKLSNASSRVLTQFIDTYLGLQDEVLNERLLNKLVFDSEVRSNIMKELGISKNSLANAESELKIKGVIKDGSINKSIIPQLDGDNLKVMIYFYR